MKLTIDKTVDKTISSIKDYNRVLKILNTKQPGDVEYSAENHLTYDEYLDSLGEELGFSLPNFKQDILEELKGFARLYRSESILALTQSQSKEGWDFRQALSEALPYFDFDTYQIGTGSIGCSLSEEMLENPYIKLLFGIE